MLGVLGCVDGVVLWVDPVEVLAPLAAAGGTGAPATPPEMPLFSAWSRANTAAEMAAGSMVVEVSSDEAVVDERAEVVDVRDAFTDEGPPQAAEMGRIEMRAIGRSVRQAALITGRS